MREISAFVLLALVASLLGAVSTHGLKIQTVANRQATINKFPGCAILGTPSWRSNTVMKNAGASNAGHCRDKCMNWWKASKRRGIELWNNDGWSAAFRHEGCYLQAAQFADPEESCTARRTGDLDSFVHDWTESWKAWPCYKGTVHQGDASSNPLPVKARFKYKDYIQSQYLHEKNGNSPDKLKVQVKSSPYICSWSKDNQGWGAHGNHYPCIAWEYNSKDNVCNVHHRRPYYTGGSFTNVNPSQGNTRVTGNMYCDNDFNKENVARDVANLYQAPGCMKHHYNWPGADLETETGFSDPHECRRWCQRHSDCVVWVYARNRNRCWLKTANAYRNEYESPNEDIYSGMKDCHTCFPGYYISDSNPANGIDSCYVCPKGYYCYEGEKTACEAGKFCGVEGLSTLLDPSSENRCDADSSGTGCEHHVCRDSALGEKLGALTFKEPADFDFSAYAIPTDAEHAGGWELVLSVPPTDSAAQDAVHVKSVFKEMIRMTIVEEYRLAVDSSVGDSTAISWGNHLNDCESAGENAPQLALDPDLRVGDEFTACLELTWRELNKPLTWAAISETHPSEVKEEAKSCVTQTISLVARGKVLVNDINAASGSQDVVLEYKIGTSEDTFQAVTDAAGEVTLEIFDNNVTFHGVDSSITFVSASKTGVETDIKLCPDDDDVECTVDNVRSLPAAFSLTHLETRQLRLVDTLSRTLEGTITQTFESAGSCHVGGVLVEAINVATDLVVAYTTSSSVDGSFALNVPINTQTQLVLTYGDHTFEAADSSDAVTTALLSGSGRQVNDNFANLEISDTTQRVLRLRAGATECDFGVGTVDVAIQVHACPGVELARTTSNVINDWTLPAANYTLSLDFPDDGDVQASFEYQFPTSDTRYVRLDIEDGLVEMLHQPVPVIDLSVRAGNLFFDTASCSDVPFDTIIEGGRTIPIRITSTQTYKSQTCGTLPGGTAVKVVSNLAPEIDVDCDPNAPCEFAFAVAEVNYESRSVTTASVICGEPQRPLGDGASHGVAEFIRSVDFSMRNPRVWDNATAGLEATLNALILGEKSIRESSTIVFSSEDSIPLHYLYAPPGGDGSYASMSFEGSFAVQTSAQAIVETESGINTGVTVSASVGSSVASVETSAGLGFGEVDAQVESYDDQVKVSTTSRSFTLTTSSAETGSAVDQVMFIGSVAQFSEAVHLAFDEETCMVTSADSIAWGNQVASMVVQTRRACEDSLDLIERTIEVESDKAGSANLVAQARLERERWLSLLQHWENDYLAALENPIDLVGQNLFEGTTTAVNRIKISDTDIDIVDSVSGQDDSVVDYESFSSSSSLDVSLGVSASVSVDLWFVSMEATTEVSHETSVVQTTSVERVTTEGEAMSTSITTHLALAGDGNSICVELFRSPFSGTHVYRVCGGLTSCPNIPGTDAREVIALTYNEKPAIELTENTGSFSFYIDTSSMPVSSDYITLAISVDAQSATGGIVYSVAGTSLNQIVEIDVRARRQHPVTVFYERLDERIRSTTVNIEVTSVCDDDVSRTLPFDLNWASTCPTISWAGALIDASATWALTSDLPTTPIAFSRGSASDSSVTSTVSLWAARYDGSATFGDWFEVTSFATGSTAMDLTAAELQAKTSSEGRFLFELRASCAVEGRSVGSTRSSQRLGVLDTIGPVLMAWAPASKVRVATSSFPVANFRFDEPVDCGHVDLEAIITDASGELSATTSISCASRLYDLTVVMETADAAAVALWSNTTVTMELRGVHDLHGNVAEVITAGGRRRALADGSVSRTFVVPVLPEHDEDTATLAQWGTQTDSERRAAVAVAYARVLPSDAAVASSYVESEDDQGVDGSGADSLMLGVGLGVTVGVVAVVAAAFFIIRRRRRQEGKRRSTASDAVSANTEMHSKVETSNPMHAAA